VGNWHPVISTVNGPAGGGAGIPVTTVAAAPDDTTRLTVSALPAAR